ncbi:MAG: 50S ribosomal protein L30 [Armatimonadetes bacterium]|nr:50S ribosomal protein L30 [Armatimonadota bacterium]
MLKITLKRSVIGSTPRNRRTVQALGLKKTGRTVFKNDTPAIRGMLRNIDHLIEMVEVDGVPKKEAKQKAAAAPAVVQAPTVEDAPKKPATKKKAAAKKPAEKKPAKKKPAAKKPAAKKAPAAKRRAFAEIGGKSKSDKKSASKKKEQ